MLAWAHDAIIASYSDCLLLDEAMARLWPCGSIVRSLGADIVNIQSLSSHYMPLHSETLEDSIAESESPFTGRGPGHCPVHMHVHGKSRPARNGSLNYYLKHWEIMI